jgi:hypothetical protein
MKTITKRKIASLILAGILTTSLSGCVTGNPFIITKESKQQEKEEKVNNAYANVKKETYVLGQLEALKFSTTGYITINNEKYNFVDPSQNPSFNRTGIEIKTIKSEVDKNAIGSIEITYATKEGVEKGDDLPFIDLEPDKYLLAQSSTVSGGSGSDPYINFHVELNGSEIEDELVASLNKAVETKIGQPNAFVKEPAQYDSSIYRILVADNSGSMSISGPDLPGISDPTYGNYFPGMLEANTFSDEIHPPEPLHYKYVDASGKNQLIDISAVEQPYYDIEKQQIAIEWVITEPKETN